MKGVSRSHLSNLSTISVSHSDVPLLTHPLLPFFLHRPAYVGGTLGWCWSRSSCVSTFPKFRSAHYCCFSSVFFLIFVGGARGFAISAPSGPVTAGDVLVSWRHDNGDPNDFFIRLRSAPGNDNGPFTQVNSNGQSQGQTKVHMDPGYVFLQFALCLR